MNSDFLTAVKNRRTIYATTKDKVVSDERIVEIIKDAVNNAPTAFNSQGSRVVVLFGENHNKVWDITKEALRKVVPPANFSDTEQKIDMFKNSYGTVLYFEDQGIIEGLQQQFALYKDNFPIWAQQSQGMLQYIIWTVLEIEGFGVSLQHYNPLIDEEVKATWSIPDNWKLIAQMPFGKPSAPPNQKEFQPLDQRVKVFN